MFRAPGTRRPRPGGRLPALALFDPLKPLGHPWLEEDDFRERQPAWPQPAADPNELVNLAKDSKQRATVMRLNKMVNALIDREIGTDDGREYPGPTELYNQPEKI